MGRRYHRIVPILVTGLLACAIPVVAWSNCEYMPAPWNCTVPPRLVACPLGDAGYEVVVRDVGNWPVVDVLVRLDFSKCSGAAFCPVQGDLTAWDPVARVASTWSNDQGVAAFHLKMGGICPDDSIEVLACSTVLGRSVGVASPDQDGNLVVNGADVAIVRGLLGTGSPQADFDGDGLVEADDLAFVAEQHYAHGCDGVVPTRRPGWGTLKQLYR